MKVGLQKERGIANCQLSQALLSIQRLQPDFRPLPPSQKFYFVHAWISMAHPIVISIAIGNLFIHKILSIYKQFHL